MNLREFIIRSTAEMFLPCITSCCFVCFIVLDFVLLVFIQVDKVTQQGQLSFSLYEYVWCVCHAYRSRTPAVRTSVLAWWPWSSPLPNPEEPDSCPKFASWTTRNVVDPRRPPRLRRRKTKRTRVRWICCTPRPSLQPPLRVRHTHTHTQCASKYRKLRDLSFNDYYSPCVHRCLPAPSESVLPATSQGPALSLLSTDPEPHSSRAAAPARWAEEDSLPLFYLSKYVINIIPDSVQICM